MAKTKVIINGTDFIDEIPPLPLLYDGPQEDVLNWIFESFPEREVTDEPVIWLAENPGITDEDGEDVFDTWRLQVFCEDAKPEDEPDPDKANTKVSITGKKYSQKDIDPIEFIFPGSDTLFLKWVTYCFPDRDVSNFPDLTIRLGRPGRPDWFLNVHLEEIE